MGGDNQRHHGRSRNESHQSPPPLDSPPQVRLYTVRQFCERHPWATPGGVRHLIFNAASNGFHRVIRRIGRRVVIDEAAFLAWLEEQD